jgi:stearoyl-CoA desaturase (delta-9 desaturase)
VTRIQRQHVIAIVGIPFLGVVAAAYLTVSHGVSWVAWSSFAVLYTATCIGIEVGYHRFFSHRAFSAGPRMRRLLGALGAMAAQGPVVYWAALHRHHHAYSDKAGDPHSPFTHPSGLWHAHIGWMMDHDVPNILFYAPDLLKDDATRKANRSYRLWVIVGLVLPTVFGALCLRSGRGALEGFLFGGLVRIFAVQHIIWSVNSICHYFGSRPHDSGDRSTNNAWIAIPSFGGSWHNAHHAFPSSAVTGFRWWQIDLAGSIIRLWERLGLVSDVKVPKTVTVAETPAFSPEPSTEAVAPPPPKPFHQNATSRTA